ncbi:MAG: A24 family peptidase C-terminal domain-containing protein [Dehalococcoidia bacterium]
MLFTLTSHYFETDIYRLAFTLLVLAYASYSDMKKRSVSNIVWLLMVVVGIAFAGYYTVVQGTSFLIPFILFATITGAVSYIFFRLGLFAAADAKALICISILFPTRPAFTILAHHFPVFDAFVPVVFPFSLIVLLNATVLALVVPVSLFFRNLHSLGLREFMRNAALSFVAYRVSISELTGSGFFRLAHQYEEIDGHLTRRCSLGGTPISSKILQQLKTYHREQKIGGEVWVAPELPFILFIALGFLIGCLIGA